MGLFSGGRRLREQINAARRIVFRWRNVVTFPSLDINQADYAYWDRARRGKAQGLELSGLFLKPIASKIAAFGFGDPLTWKLDEDKDLESDLNDWWQSKHPEILLTVEEMLSLGDLYIVMNADYSLTLVPPQIVEPIVSGDNYSRIIGYKIYDNFPHPTESATTMRIIHEYTAEKHVVIVERGGAQVDRQEYRNPIKRIPVVHARNRKGVDEMFGRPEAESLPPALHRYGGVFEAALNGNVRQGRPTPVVEEMGTAEAVNQFWEKHGRQERQTLPDGTVETMDVIDFDSDQLLTLPGSGKFKYAQPGSFAGDTEKLLALIFYLIIEHSEIPEFAWGSAIASSKASAETQMPPFARFLEKKRGLSQGWLTELASLYLAYRGVVNSKRTEKLVPKAVWKPLTGEDEELKLKAVDTGVKLGIVDDETALRNLPLDIDNPVAVLQKARDEAAERKDQFDSDIENALNNADDSGASDDNQDEDELEDAA